MESLLFDDLKIVGAVFSENVIDTSPVLKRFKTSNIYLALKLMLMFGPE